MVDSLSPTIAAATVAVVLFSGTSVAVEEVDPFDVVMVLV